MYGNNIFSPFTIHLGERTLTYTQPALMGILNVTPDSFFDGGRYLSDEQLLAHAGQLLQEGADILDVGVTSSRPGAVLPAPEEEAPRLARVVRLLRSAYPQAVISIDTCFSLSAQQAVAAGADIVNDISGGQFDERMFPVVAELGVPYVLMHTPARPDSMQQQAHYDDVVAAVGDFWEAKLEQLQRLGVRDVLLDPGFGFGKTLQHNFQLVGALPQLRKRFPERPLLVAVSRKSMIYQSLGVTPQGALHGTVALHVLCIERGVHLLRVHDVAATRQAMQMWQQVQEASSET